MRNNVTTDCCYKCNDRKIGCHTICEKYQNFCKENEKTKEKIKQTGIDYYERLRTIIKSGRSKF